MKTKALVLPVFAMLLFSGNFAQLVNIPDKAEDDYARKHANTRDVPAEVKESFCKSKYRDWEVNETAFVENHNNRKMYRYEVTKGVDKKYVFFDKAGKLVNENPAL